MIPTRTRLPRPQPLTVYTPMRGVVLVTLPGYVLRVHRVRPAKGSDTANHARADVVLPDGTSLRVEYETNGCTCDLLRGVVGRAVRAANRLTRDVDPDAATTVSAIVERIPTTCRPARRTRTPVAA